MNIYIYYIESYIVMCISIWIEHDYVYYVYGKHIESYWLKHDYIWEERFK